MNHLEPFHWVLGFSILGTAFSVVDMNEALRFAILVGTSIGVFVKTWEQIRKSEKFAQDMKMIWKTTKNMLRKTRQK